MKPKYPHHLTPNGFNVVARDKYDRKNNLQEKKARDKRK